MGDGVDEIMTDENALPLMMAAASGVATLILASGLAFALMRRSKKAG